MPTPTAPLDNDACYRALKARDARFDGRFFTGVSSTGIYCRPVCKVRTPKPENCKFFTLAAQAEQAGYRPCLRCRPEIAPGGGWNAVWSTQDASRILAQHAADLLDRAVQTGQTGRLPDVAAQLGVSERHLRRIFEAQWGISPLQYLQTRRLLSAKQWLTDTNLPIGQIARLSGFSSLRRFNAAFLAHYRLQPRALRKAGANAPSEMPPRGGSSVKVNQALKLQASYRPPYDVPALLRFLQQRAIAGVETVDLPTQSYCRTLALERNGQCLAGWVQARFLSHSCAVELQISESLGPALPQIFSRLRNLLDLDADPDAIASALGEQFPGTEGVRVPGTLCGFELAVRGILGQQITVAAARTLTRRLVQALGTPLVVPTVTSFNTPAPELTHLFPSPSQLAGTDGDTLGALGIVKQRQAALIAVARAVASGSLVLEPWAPVEATMAALLEMPGIGPWTAHYIAMRALRWPDAFPAGDVALQSSLGVRQHKQAAQEAERLSQAWRPWRSYAVVRAWQALSNVPKAAP